MLTSLRDIAAHIECAAIIQKWALSRDQCRWDALEQTFTPDGVIAVSWYRGPISGFVHHLRTRDPARAGVAKHHVFPAFVQVNGDRALAETSIVIMVRQAIEGVLVDLNSKGRFLDRLELHKGAWLIKERAAIYEQDRLDPVEPSVAFNQLLEGADTSIFPMPYRYMAFRVAAAGGKLAEPILFDGSPALEEVRARYQAWLDETSAS